MSIASNRLPEFLLIKNVQRWIDIRKIDAIFANIFGLSINTKFIHIHLINRSFVATPDNRTNIRRGIQFIWCEANNQVPTFIICIKWRTLFDILRFMSADLICLMLYWCYFCWSMCACDPFGMKERNWKCRQKSDIISMWQTQIKHTCCGRVREMMSFFWDILRLLNILFLTW